MAHLVRQRQADKLTDANVAQRRIGPGGDMKPEGRCQVHMGCEIGHYHGPSKVITRDFAADETIGRLCLRTQSNLNADTLPGGSFTIRSRRPAVAPIDNDSRCLQQGPHRAAGDVELVVR